MSAGAQRTGAVQRDMTIVDQPAAVAELAADILRLLRTGRQVPPLSARPGGFGLAEAYRVAATMRTLREGRGEKAIGRKIGLTNHAAWQRYGISAPIWNYVFDTTAAELPAGSGTFSLDGLPEPRIEAEIVVHLRSAPVPGMSAAELIGCIDWIAHGFEVVQSVFPSWQFQAADGVAAFGLHAGLLIGPRQSVSGDRDGWLERLSGFSLEMEESGGASRRGRASDLLGGPVQALQCLIDDIERFPAAEPLRAGEIVTTGSLTEAMPVHRGDTWRTRFEDLELGGMTLSFV